MVIILILTIVALILFISGLLIKKKNDYKKYQNEYNIALEKAEKIISSYDKEQYDFMPKRQNIIKDDLDWIIKCLDKDDDIDLTRADGKRFYFKKQKR